ncbi:hypothetical protein LTR50_001026 [Elasticomyces elasticus]|nr:hypothetical protein LTR50_001026 [Elasticomyces elasticus]
MVSSSVFSPSYPTRSTTFLKSLRRQGTTDDHIDDTGPNGSRHSPPQAAVPLKVIVVGAGLGGLATAIALLRRGHSVTILEQASALGIQIPSNSNRILLSWGLGSYLEGKAVEPEGMTFRRWENGKPIGYTKLVPEFRQNFGSPYYVVHRAHFHDAMHKLALQLGVHIEVASRVVSFNAEEAKVEVASGKTYSGDLVVAADGQSHLLHCLNHARSVSNEMGRSEVYGSQSDIERT